MAANNEAADVQALADRGFRSLTGACYLLLCIESPALAKNPGCEPSISP